MFKIDLIQFSQACKFGQQVLKITFMYFGFIFKTVREAYSEPSQSKMGRVAKIKNGFYPVTVLYF